MNVLKYYGKYILVFLFSSLAVATNYDSIDNDLGNGIFGVLSDEIELNSLDSDLGYIETIIEEKNKDRKNIYISIEKLLINNRYSEARNKIEELLNRYANDPNIYNILGKLEALENNKVAAKKSYNKSIKLYQNNLLAYQGLARIALDERQFIDANSYADKMLNIDNKYYVTYLILSEINFKKNNYKSAENFIITAYGKAKGNIDKEIEVLIVLGKFYANQKEIKKILSFAEDLYNRNPNNSKVISFFASNLIANKKFTQAEKLLKIIIEKDNKDTKHRVMLARVISDDLGRKSEVIKLFDEAIGINKNNINSLVLKASYLTKIGRIKEAINTTNKIIELFPDKGLGYQLKGDVYLADKKNNKAIDAYRQAYNVDSDSPALYVLARLLAEQGKVKEAVNLLKFELGKNKNDSVIHFKLGSIYQKAADYSKAEHYYKLVLKKRPENVLALNNLAWVYSQQGNKQAIEYAEKAYELAPHSPAIADTFGYILVLQGKAREGVEVLKLAFRKAPQIGDIQFHLAKGYSLLGQKEKAINLLDALEKKGLSFSEKSNSKKLLKKLQSE